MDIAASCSNNIVVSQPTNTIEERCHHDVNRQSTIHHGTRRVREVDHFDQVDTYSDREEMREMRWKNNNNETLIMVITSSPVTQNYGRARWSCLPCVGCVCMWTIESHTVHFEREGVPMERWFAPAWQDHIAKG